MGTSKKTDSELADEMNDFYARFDTHDFSAEHSSIRETVSTADSDITIDEEAVLYRFKTINQRKSSGPDNVSGRLLKSCAEQLCGIFRFIFQMSLNLQKVPRIWKEATIVPVAKNNTPKTLNDFRPVALTSVVMKSFERIVKCLILNQVHDKLDPLQFAYRAGRGVEDATLTLLSLIVKHLKGTKTHARVLYIDFSSAFNTLQPHLLTQKLISRFNLDFKLVGWVLDFLVQRTQRVRVNGCLSDFSTVSTGSPQGCCLSPFLYILYTDDCRSPFEDRHIIKFSDDSAIVSLLHDQNTDHGPVVDYFVQWCIDAYLHLNVTKTKDMCIDFRKTQQSPQNTVINGDKVDFVQKYKYLGTFIDNKLTWEDNTDAICSKAAQRLFFLRKLNYFQVDNTILTLFYRSFIESVLTFSLVCWFGNMSVKNKNRLSRFVNICSKITGTQQASLSLLYDKQLRRKAHSIMSIEDHPLRQEFEALPSGRRLKVPKFRTNRARLSFVPRAISLLKSIEN